ncbi:MAG: PDZ domain-containing protein [Eubacterium sp.]|nr:PDZ domain-containing protein [Eubacterium sp.]
MSEENMNGYYQSQDNNQFNNPKNNKNNKGMIAIIVAAISVVVIVGCAIAIVALLKKDTGKLGQNPVGTEKQSNEHYEDIGSTNATQNTNTGGSVVVTDVSGVVENTMPSIVAITSKTVMEQSNQYGSIYDYFFNGRGGGTEQYEVEGAGSGIIVDQTDTELLIVTNNHVVEGANSLKIQFNGMESKDAVDGSIKGTNANVDVAVVAVKLKDIPQNTLKNIKKATLGDSDQLKVGEGVIAIGNALGYGQSVTTGVISAKDREATIENKTMKLLQTDAAINGGNSGGALLNAKGEVIGINVAKYSSNGSTSASVEGMGFAIPITSVKNIISNLETRQTREKLDADKQGYLGITSKYDVTADISEAYSMPTGIYIYETTKGGPADKAGIQSGDIIREFDGQQVDSMDALQNIVQYYKPGEKIKVKIAYASGREYKEKDVTVTLADKSTIENLQKSDTRVNQ